MEYRLLGPLQVRQGEAPVDIGPPKQRAVLATLLLAHGRVVSTDRLIDAVWGDEVPGSATASLQAYISNLRKALRTDTGAASPIVRQAPGYFLDASAATVDLVDFTGQCALARTAIADGQWRAALAAADAALTWWRGPLLEDLRDEHWVRHDSAGVDELRTECRENRVTALLALGRGAEALTDANRLHVEEPLRDRACWLLMMALYRAGRGPDALAAYTGHAAHLDAELGLEPGAELRELQTAILRQSPELAAWPRTPAWTGADDVPAPTVAVTPTAPADPEARGALIGRGRELAMLARVLDDAAAGATRWLVLTGPPGIGKTRLAEEAAARVADAGGRVVWVNCPDERGTPPWWPMRQLVRALGADADAVLEVPPDADPDTARFLVYERIHALLQTTQPLAVVIDDAQWADPTSASCLAYIAGALRDHPVAIIVTVRDGDHLPELTRLLGTVARGDRNRHIDVPALSTSEVAALANDVVEDPQDHVTDSEAAILADRTGGNPFFVSEYARLPREERTAGDIPSAIKSVLDRRLAGLDPAVLQVLRAAAVVGDTLDGSAFGLLAETTRLDLDTLADYLDEAADERILVSAHDSTGYEFAHGLLREHLLAALPALRRQRLHAKVAEVLAGNNSHDSISRRAQHLIAALPLVEPAAVVQACRLAAEHATQQWSSDTAARWWRAALDAYDQLPAPERDDAERDGLTVELLEALGRAGRGQTVLDSASSGLVEALAAGRAATAGRVAAALLRVSGSWPWLAPGADPSELLALLDRTAELCDGDPAAGARVAAALAVGHCYNLDPAVPAGLLDTAARLAEQTDDPDVIADALIGKIITYSGVSQRSADMLRWVDTLIALPHSRIYEDAVIGHSVATMAAMNLGDATATQRHLQAGIEGSEKLRLPVIRAQLRWMEAVLAVWRGDLAEAQRHHDVAVRVHEQTELYGAGSGMIATTALLRETGETVDGAALLGEYHDTGGEGMIEVARAALLTVQTGPVARAQAIDVLSRGPGIPHVWTSLGFAALRAHLCADHRLTDFAPGLLDELEPWVDRIAMIGQVGIAGPVPLATARLHALLGDTERAREHLAMAEAIAARNGGFPALLRCRLLRCEVDGNAAAAVAVAADAERIGMHGVAAAARALG
ncbi:MAG: BTAD domain-containing putative transcriptional regulator [Mycobacterium sp.]